MQNFDVDDSLLIGSEVREKFSREEVAHHVHVDFRWRSGLHIKAPKRFRGPAGIADVLALWFHRLCFGGAHTRFEPDEGNHQVRFLGAGAAAMRFS
jgi:hypothetical protein